ncbi:hypothetical protein F7725_007356 [Dissostichus mawsoni]|uniref:EMI domain-containing protein n=1 Tax=Dissostichus mawsoni TaxID=36200 RepID=A0A7J5XWI8_DISMA|nr:hypothetical protein F7725_007356 [Dissostichus mawsoni]
MSWMLSICVATALLALCRGQNTEHEGNSLSASGYRLCTYNETRNVSLLVMHAVPYTVTKPCGGWLHWKTCTVTLYRMTHETETRTVKQQGTRCCPGHDPVQLQMECITDLRAVSGTLTARAGKNAVRVPFVTSAVILQPVHPFRTATSILIACNLTLSLHTVTSELHLLLKHIQEVCGECALSALRGCSPHSDCNNTVGSYLCSCHQGYVDVDPSNPGAHCTADVRVETTPQPCLTSVPPMNTTTISALQQHPGACEEHH